jgi:hypothetical protein
MIGGFTTTSRGDLIIKVEDFDWLYFLARNFNVTQESLKRIDTQRLYVVPKKQRRKFMYSSPLCFKG